MLGSVVTLQQPGYAAAATPGVDVCFILTPHSLPLHPQPLQGLLRHGGHHTSPQLNPPPPPCTRSSCRACRTGPLPWWSRTPSSPWTAISRTCRWGLLRLRAPHAAARATCARPLRPCMRGRGCMERKRALWRPQQPTCTWGVTLLHGQHSCWLPAGAGWRGWGGALGGAHWRLAMSKSRALVVAAAATEHDCRPVVGPKCSSQHVGGASTARFAFSFLFFPPLQALAALAAATEHDCCHVVGPQMLLCRRWPRCARATASSSWWMRRTPRWCAGTGGAGRRRRWGWRTRCGVVCALSTFECLRWHLMDVAAQLALPHKL